MPPLLHAATDANSTTTPLKRLQCCAREAFAHFLDGELRDRRRFGVGGAGTGTRQWWRKYGPAVSRLTPTCVWRISSELVFALQERFGDPVDAYVNGSQVWLRDDGPAGVTIEWRLHPVADYEPLDGVDTYDVFTTTSLALAQGATPPKPVEQLWDGLEAFAAYSDEVEPATLGAATSEALGIPADACGVVDHQRIGDEWEKSRGATSIVDALLAQLSG